MGSRVSSRKQPDLHHCVRREEGVLTGPLDCRAGLRSVEQRSAMNVDRREAAARGNLRSAHRSLTLSGVLLLGGFVVNAIQRGLLHPSGAEDDHEAIFAKYAESDVWVATHFAEFVLVLVTFGGFLVLCRALWRDTPYLALLAAGTITVAAATGLPFKRWMASRSSSQSMLEPLRRGPRSQPATQMPKSSAGSSGDCRATSGCCSA